MSLEIIKSEICGFVLRPQFEYEFEQVEWEISEEAQSVLFQTNYRTRYQAKTAAQYWGYEVN